MWKERAQDEVNHRLSHTIAENKDGEHSQVVGKRASFYCPLFSGFLPTAYKHVQLKKKKKLSKLLTLRGSTYLLLVTAKLLNVSVLIPTDPRVHLCNKYVANVYPVTKCLLGT